MFKISINLWKKRARFGQYRFRRKLKEEKISRKCVLISNEVIYYGDDPK